MCMFRFLHYSVSYYLLEKLYLVDGHLKPSFIKLKNITKVTFVIFFNLIGTWRYLFLCFTAFLLNQFHMRWTCVKHRKYIQSNGHKGDRNLDLTRVVCRRTCPSLSSLLCWPTNDSMTKWKDFVCLYLFVLQNTTKYQSRFIDQLLVSLLIRMVQITHTK